MNQTFKLFKPFKPFKPFKHNVGILIAAFSVNAWFSPVLEAAPKQLTPLQSLPAVQPASSAENTAVWGAVESANPAAFDHRSNNLPPIISHQNSIPPIVNGATRLAAAPILEASPIVAAPLMISTPPIIGSSATAAIAQIKPLKNKTDQSKTGNKTAPNEQPSEPRIDAVKTVGSAANDDELVATAAAWQESRGRNSGYLTTGFSAAGVPLYAGQTPAALQTAQTAQPDQSTPGLPFGLGVDSPSGQPTTEPRIAAPQINTPPIAALPNIRDSNDRANRDIVAPNNSAMGSVVEPRMPGASDSNWFNSPPMEAPVLTHNGNNNGGGCHRCGGSGCSSCASGNAGNYGGGNPYSSINNLGGVSDPAGYNSCGTNGCTSCGPNGCFDQNAIDDSKGYFGAVSEARRYITIDFVYLFRGDGDVVLSNFGSTGNYNGDSAFAITIGERRDATQGHEFSYFGTTDLNEDATRVDALGRMRALFGVSSFFAGNEASPFFNSVSQVERKSTNLQSVEFNRTRWGWDVVKSFTGFRFIYAGDEYNLDSRNLAGETGNFNMSAENYLFGVHAGTELFYDVGYRMSLSGIGKIGAHANLNQFRGRMSKLGTTILDNSDNNTTFSTSIELALLGHYQLTRRSRFRIGYQYMHLGDVLSTADNIPGTLTPFLGTNASDRDDMNFYGLMFGFEFYR